MVNQDNRRMIKSVLWWSRRGILGYPNEEKELNNLLVKETNLTFRAKYPEVHVVLFSVINYSLSPESLNFIYLFYNLFKRFNVSFGLTDYVSPFVSNWTTQTLVAGSIGSLNRQIITKFQRETCLLSSVQITRKSVSNQNRPCNIDSEYKWRWGSLQGMERKLTVSTSL